MKSFKVAFTAIALFGVLAGGFTCGFLTADKQGKIAQANLNEAWELELINQKTASEELRQATIDAYEADIAGFQRTLAKFQASSYEDHSDWLDCQIALRFISEHLSEVDHIDTVNPIPVIYLTDGSVYTVDEGEIVSFEVFESTPDFPSAPIGDAKAIAYMPLM